MAAGARPPAARPRRGGAPGPPPAAPGPGGAAAGAAGGASSPPGPRELARAWAGAHPGFRFAVWLGPGGREAGGLTYGGLWARAGGVARALRGRLGLRPGDRALLVYPPGLEFTCAFLGCLRAGVVAVPVCPAVPGRLAAEAERLRAVAEDSGARVALTDSGYLLVARYAAGRKALLRASRAVLGARGGGGGGGGGGRACWTGRTCRSRRRAGWGRTRGSRTAPWGRGTSRSCSTRRAPPAGPRG